MVACTPSSPFAIIKVHHAVWQNDVELYEQLIEMKRLETEKLEQEKRAEEAQKRAMAALADQFEQNVGSIVGIVASAATELEAAAQTLNVTLEETNAQAGTRPRSR